MEPLIEVLILTFCLALLVLGLGLPLLLPEGSLIPDMIAAAGAHHRREAVLR